MRTVSIAVGGVVAVALVVAGLWAWGDAAEIVDGARQPYSAKWAVRCGAVAAVAAAQALLSFFLIAAVFRRDFFTSAVRFTAGLVGGAALVSAVALGFAGR